jgi:hypothetical protein
MSDSTWDVQAAIFSRLSADSNITALLADGANSILDYVPSGANAPYIVLGETRAEPFDTATDAGCEVMIAIHSYSRSLGMKEARDVMTAVYNSLHRASFAVSGHSLILCHLLDSETVMEADGQTRHGIQRFRVITEPVV